tara:strand:- start:15963 stop:16223 length:261 start_codon:yes stop_codon:yes gene_type:complete
MFGTSQLIKTVSNLNPVSRFTGGSPSTSDNIVSILVALMVISIILLIKSYIVQLSYNRVAKKINSKEDLSLTDSFMLVVLVVGLML